MQSDMNDLWGRYEDVTQRRAPTFAASPANVSGYSALTKPRKIRFLGQLDRALAAFTPSERLVLYVLSCTLALSALFLLNEVNSLVSVVIPAAGGELVEGEVGPARFINPLLTLSQPDQDLAALVYSGLMRALPDGSFVPDLAEGYTVSSDGKTYTFTLRPDAVFQDGTSVTSADVVFTIQEALDPAVNSSHRADWTGVQVSAPDERTIVFTLPHAYAPFMNDTTLGILPKHLWQNVSAEEFPFNPLNTHPIGSGPYEVSGVNTDATGAASRYELSAFDRYALGTPYLSRIAFVFYPDENSLIAALNKHEIDAAAALPAGELPSIKRTDLLLAEAPLPRDFGVFFNQSHNTVLADVSVRQALDAAVEKTSIVDGVFGGRAQILSGPIPQSMLEGGAVATPGPLIASTFSKGAGANVDAARAILMKGGWTLQHASSTTATSSTAEIWTKKKQLLSFTLATADEPELVATANELVATWNTLGAQVSLQIYPLTELNTLVIRPRSYDALLFGEVVGPELDLYAFWHSSQRNDPGLNLALYANPKTDLLLSEARATSDATQRNQLYAQFEDLLASDHPAIFLYVPDFLYVVPQTLQGVELGSLATPSDRFANVEDWYMDTERVWKIFAPDRY